MAFEIEFTDEFETWWSGLTGEEQESVAASVGLLEERGHALGHPHTSDIKGSRHGRMRELRIQHRGRPFRLFYAWDPRRVCILLIGGDKTGDKSFYARMIAAADDLYDTHIELLLQEGEGEQRKGEPP